MGPGRLDVDELIRHELNRAQDTKKLLELYTNKKKKKENSDSQNENISTTLLKYKYREKWRVQREDKIILLQEECTGENRVLLMQHLKKSAFETYKDKDDLGEFVCLSSWGHGTFSETLKDLVYISRNHYNRVLECVEARLCPNSKKGRMHTLRMPGSQERPGNIVEKSTQHRIYQLRKQYNLHIIQRAVRAFLGRKLQRKVQSCKVIVKWYKFWKRRMVQLQACREHIASRTIVRYLRFWKLRRLSTLAGEANLNHYSCHKVLLIQSLCRMWCAKNNVTFLRWERKLKDKAREMRAWRKTLQIWGDPLIHNELATLCSNRVQTEKQFIEIELLKGVEIKRCHTQYKNYEKKTTAAMYRAKLPPGWVLHENEEDLGDDREEESECIADDQPATAKKRKKKRYLNMKTGQVVSTHPLSHKVEEMKRQQKFRATNMLEQQLQRLDDYAFSIRNDEEHQRRYCADIVLQNLQQV